MRQSESLRARKREKVRESDEREAKGNTSSKFNVWDKGLLEMFTEEV